MNDSESLSHSKWECKYHVVFIPKCRRKTLYEQLRPHLGEAVEHGDLLTGNGVGVEQRGGDVPIAIRYHPH